MCRSRLCAHELAPVQRVMLVTSRLAGVSYEWLTVGRHSRQLKVVHEIKIYPEHSITV